MELTLHKSKMLSTVSIAVSGSKSESNRMLILQAQYPNILIKNCSNSDDTVAMKTALSSAETTIDVHHAGTTMRFLTAYFAGRENTNIVLTGSKRMKERPIKVLVDALIKLGADISYLEGADCPPLAIKGKRIRQHKVALKANVSSQYISALLLIAPKLKNGLELQLLGDITSLPYIQMTLDLLSEIGVEYTFKNNCINVHPMPKLEGEKILSVESDWSSASYFYSMVALSQIGTTIHLAHYKENSLQGDSVLASIYSDFGVSSTFKNQQLILTKTHEHSTHHVDYNLKASPDIAQTIAITCLGLGISCDLKGLHTLKIKETDRLVALKNEIEKLGGEIEISDESLKLFPSQQITSHKKIATYNDHRMAMAFAPLALKTSLIIEDAGVVSKSYPDFWKDIKTLGIKITE